jgi:hypothetical protein
MGDSQQPDFTQLALASTREIFAQANPYLFLVGEDTLNRPRKPAPTAQFRKLEPEETTMTQSSIKPMFHGGLAASGSNPPVGAPRPTKLALAVHKVTQAFPDMVTIGRTANNDVILPDVSVSKFHAYFRLLGRERAQIVDAGSKNGTWLNGVRLPARGEPTLIQVGDALRLGTLEMVVMDARGCWHALRSRPPGK